MMRFLKGNYDLDVQGVQESKEKTTDYEHKAINSVGGSMVFVEKKRTIWRKGEKAESLAKIGEANEPREK